MWMLERAWRILGGGGGDETPQASGPLSEANTATTTTAITITTPEKEQHRRLSLQEQGAAVASRELRRSQQSLDSNSKSVFGFTDLKSNDAATTPIQLLLPSGHAISDSTTSENSSKSDKQDNGERQDNSKNLKEQTQVIDLESVPLLTTDINPELKQCQDSRQPKEPGVLFSKPEHRDSSSQQEEHYRARNGGAQQLSATTEQHLENESWSRRVQNRSATDQSRSAEKLQGEPQFRLATNHAEKHQEEQYPSSTNHSEKHQEEQYRSATHHGEKHQEEQFRSASEQSRDAEKLQGEAQFRPATNHAEKHQEFRPATNHAEKHQEEQYRLATHHGEEPQEEQYRSATEQSCGEKRHTPGAGTSRVSALRQALLAQASPFSPSVARRRRVPESEADPLLQRITGADEERAPEPRHTADKAVQIDASRGPHPQLVQDLQAFFSEKARGQGPGALGTTTEAQAAPCKAKPARLPIGDHDMETEPAAAPEHGEQRNGMPSPDTVRAARAAGAASGEPAAAIRHGGGPWDQRTSPNHDDGVEDKCLECCVYYSVRCCECNIM